jgi:hypothetical protein
MDMNTVQKRNCKEDHQVCNLPIFSAVFRSFPQFSAVFRSFPQFSAVFRGFPQFSAVFRSFPQFFKRWLGVTLLLNKRFDLNPLSKAFELGRFWGQNLSPYVCMYGGKRPAKLFSSRHIWSNMQWQIFGSVILIGANFSCSCSITLNKIEKSYHSVNKVFTTFYVFQNVPICMRSIRITVSRKYDSIGTYVSVWVHT